MRVVDLDLERLSPGAFQSMAAALSQAVFGPLTLVMGAGKDGGRDMYHQGKLTWTNGQAAGEDWDGYTVFQVKHKDRLDPINTVNATWLWSEVKKELDLWADPAKGRAPMPDQLVFITNVPLTPAPSGGGHDNIRTNLAGYRKRLEDSTRDVDTAATVARVRKRDRIRAIKRVEFWDGNQLKSLLTVHDGVRRRFDAFLTVSDVFSAISEFTDVVALKDGATALLDHARTELSTDGLVYFDQAGSRDNRGIPVHDVAIDLPLTFATRSQPRTTVLEHVLGRGNLVLARDISSVTGPRHIIVTGQPGNGKSTVSQLVVQSFRAAALEGSPNLSSGHKDTIAGTREVLRRLGHELPKNRRWPIKVNLAKYAEESGHLEDATLLRYLADKITSRSQTGKITPAALGVWMRRWPWLVVLDGLDEVTETLTRRRIIQRVVEFAHNAEGDDVDLLILLTTRPMGYTEDIEPDLFETVALDDLMREEAVRFGMQATRVRIGDNPERLEKVEAALVAASHDDNLAKLLRTPLQVLILAIIVDGAGTVEPDRYSLFWNYYDTVVRRERGKSAGLRNLLTQFAPLIQQLHERAGFKLQQLSERGDHSNATLTNDDVRALAWKVLKEAEYEPDGAHADVLDNIVKASMDRLVLLAPRSDGLGFDVRSLQELMAALFIMNTSPDQMTTRLRVAAPGPHWRNTWLFAAGKLFYAPETHAHQQLVELVETIDHDASRRLGGVVPIGPRMALDILDDGMARAWPNWRRRLLTHGLQVLREPSPQDLHAIARILVRYADNGPSERTDVADGLRLALSGRPTTRDTTQSLLKLIPGLESDLNVGEATRGLGQILRDPAAPVEPATPADWDDLDTEIATAPGSAGHLPELIHAATTARNMRASHGDVLALTEAIGAALADDEAATVLEQALLHVAAAEPVLFATLRDEVVPDLHRRPVGGALERTLPAEPNHG